MACINSLHQDLLVLATFLVHAVVPLRCSHCCLDCAQTARAREGQFYFTLLETTCPYLTLASFPSQISSSRLATKSRTAKLLHGFGTNSDADLLIARRKPRLLVPPGESTPHRCKLHTDVLHVSCCQEMS